MCKFWPKRTAALAKKQLKYLGPFGLALQLCGTVFVDRAKREKAIDAMKHAVDKLVKDEVR